MEGPKGWREFCSMAGAAILKFETDKNELLEVTIFADRTTCRATVWNISYKCGNWQSTCLLPGNADSEAYEDSILWHMVEIANAFHDNSSNYIEYYSPAPYRGYKITREIASERAIYCGFNKELKWKDFPEEIKALFSYIPEEDNKDLDTCEMIKTFIYNQKSWFYIVAVVLGLAFLYYCVASFFS
jgi:hypothetical protein